MNRRAKWAHGRLPCTLRRVRISRRQWGVAASVATAGAVVVAFVAAPRIVRGRAIAALHARGVEATIGRARLSWGRVELDDVHASLEGVPGLVVDTATVGVKWTLGGLGDVEASGVRVGVDGDSAELKAAVEAWRTRHAGARPSGAGESHRTVTLADVQGSWRANGTEVASFGASELRVLGDRIGVRGGRGSARFRGYGLRVAGVTTELSRASGKLGGLTVDQVTVDTSIAAQAVEAARSVVPAAAEGGAGAGGGEAAGPWRFATTARAWMERALEHFESGIELRVNEIVLATDHGSLGPWGARAVLGAEAVSFELDPGDKAGRKPLVLRALVPRGRGKWSAELKIGPATLSELGIREGASSLTDVDTASVEARGAVEIDPDDRTFAADGSVSLKGAAITEPRLADGTVRGIDVSVRGVVASKDDLSTWSLTGGALELGKLRFEAEGGVELGKVEGGKRQPKLWLSWAVPVVPCGDALTAMPKGLLPKLEGMEMNGTFGAHGRLAFDARAPEKTEVDLFLEQKCRVTKAPPAISVERFRSPFELRVYDPKGNPKLAMFGPGTPEWVPYEKISPYVVDALMTCEDGAFFSHNGFSAGAIRNAIIANIKAGKFALGASTISMQTAKNVFLDRRKQLSRKLQEAVLTMWLEQAMKKDEILELYLNVIEFGPNLYGIGPASMHYFGRLPSDLDPLEALFLVSILPSPVKRHSLWEKGDPGEGYSAYLRTLLKEERARGHLEEDEYQAAIAHKLVFHKAGDPPPAPHSIQAAKATIGKPGVDDPAFDPAWAPPAD